MSEKNMWAIEESLYEKGFELVCGVDEAGRGPLAGPVCAAAVILPHHCDIPELDDSKKLSDKRRRELFPLIREKALAYGVAFVHHEEIDEINILQATFLAMKQAVSQLEKKPDFVLIDGNRATEVGAPVQTVVHGDSLSASIAAASILAKVTRDDYMVEMAEKYPAYGFEIHKGYGTKVHCQAILEHGPCEIHRKSFLKKLYGQK